MSQDYDTHFLCHCCTLYPISFHMFSDGDKKVRNYLYWWILYLLILAHSRYTATAISDAKY